MKLKPLCLFFASILPLLSHAADIKVERYSVSFPKGDRVSYSGSFAKNFPQGLPVGIGSGLVFSGIENGDLLLTTTTDRGPNADAPSVGKQDSKIFANPMFVPLLMDIRISKGQAMATNLRPLHDKNGPISGLPLPSNLIGSTNEVALSDTLHPLTSDKRGLDTEGLTTDGKGGFWLGDEYGPFLIHVDHQGEILAKYGPTPTQDEQGVATGLPNILKWRQPNRGFEGITRLPNGKILIAVQSTLDINGKSKNIAQFTRLVSFDPTTGQTTMYGYPIDVTNYTAAQDAIVSDIVAIDNQHILLIEQGKNKNKQMMNKIYLVDLTQASDLTPLDNSDTAPEFNDIATLTQRGIKLAQKHEVADLRKLGWQHNKVEGLALIDNKRIAVLNDNDFGLQPNLVNADPKENKIANYQVDQQGKLSLNGQPVKTTIELQSRKPAESLSELWVLTLPKPLS
ncbi:MAG: esterase-like activity of phytase family protein [Plesiomonas sp.]